jgi:predicted N-acyltransferase
MAPHWLMFVAHQGGRRVAASLLALDPERRHAYGRYWGAVEHIPLLHFEACYYQPLQWCIEQGYRRFEGGAQGEHKMARGLLPVRTQSAHWLAHPRFASAVADFLRREGAGIDAYVDELRERNPFKAA